VACAVVRVDTDMRTRSSVLLGPPRSSSVLLAEHARATGGSAVEAGPARRRAGPCILAERRARRELRPAGLARFGCARGSRVRGCGRSATGCRPRARRRLAGRGGWPLQIVLWYRDPAAARLARLVRGGGRGSLPPELPRCWRGAARGARLCGFAGRAAAAPPPPLLSVVVRSRLAGERSVLGAGRLVLAAFPALGARSSES